MTSPTQHRSSSVQRPKQWVLKPVSSQICTILKQLISRPLHHCPDSSWWFSLLGAGNFEVFLNSSVLFLFSSIRHLLAQLVLSFVLSICMLYYLKLVRVRICLAFIYSNLDITLELFPESRHVIYISWYKLEWPTLWDYFYYLIAFN